MNIEEYYGMICSPKEEMLWQYNIKIYRNCSEVRADLHARLNLMPYDGTPEIKDAWKMENISMSESSEGMANRHRLM